MAGVWDEELSLSLFVGDGGLKMKHHMALYSNCYTCILG
jgi:hypothetical protein